MKFFINYINVQLFRGFTIVRFNNILIFVYKTLPDYFVITSYTIWYIVYITISIARDIRVQRDRQKGALSLQGKSNTSFI